MWAQLSLKANMESFIKEATISWIAASKDELRSTTINLVDASDSSLTLEANGQLLLHMAIPSSILNKPSSDEVFLVTSSTPDHELSDNLLMSLNEKLERLHVVEPDALHQALECLLVALKSHEVVEAEKMQKGCRISAKGDASHDDEHASQDEEENEASGTEEDEDVCDEMEFVEDGPGDPDGYDMASDDVMESHRVLSKGFLFHMAQDANRKCQTVRFKTPNWTQMDYTMVDCDTILPWCIVKPEPAFLAVYVHMHIGGIVQDDGAAAALGLPLDSLVKICLHFAKEDWTQADYNPHSHPLKLDACYVKTKTQPNPAAVDDDDKKDDTDKRYVYGIDVLLPDLIRAYFDFLGKRTVSTLKGEDILIELCKFSSQENPLTGLIYFLGAKLGALPNWCVFCGNSLPYSVSRLRTCNQEWCLYKFEELGLGMSVLQEVQKSPALIDLELSLTLAAAKSIERDVLEPFPEFLLNAQEIRGRSGWFSKKQTVSGWFSKKQTVSTSNTKKTVSTSDRKQKASTSSNKNMGLLISVVSSYPPLSKMEKCVDEVSLKRALALSWQDALKSEMPPLTSGCTKKMCLPYDLLRFLLSTSRLTLHHLSNTKCLDFEGSLCQFAVIHDSPEREAHFEDRRNEQGGSFFAFHGSSARNWYSILRNGLRCLSKTPYMSVGAQYGSGIYVATAESVSLRYSVETAAGWKHGSLRDEFSVLAICEIINGSASKCRSAASGVMMVPPKNEEDITVRYIIVLPGSKYTQGNHITDAEFLCTYKRNGKGDASLCERVNLLQHHRNLRDEHHRMQDSHRQACKKVRWEAMSTIRDMEKQIEEWEEQILLEKDKPLTKDMAIEQPEVRPWTKGMPIRPGMQAIQKELKNLVNQIDIAKRKHADEQSSGNEDVPILAGIEVELPDEGNLCKWHVSLSQALFKGWPLHRDLAECAKQRKEPSVAVKLECVFPETFPMAPPFIRVVSPRFNFHTGHVTVGGSICMELLTDSGWSPAFCFESVLVQIVSAMIEGGARLHKEAAKTRAQYSELEARSAFDRVARDHGWIIKAQKF